MKSKAFTLIEVMVAILVLALGVIGVYALVPAVIRVTAVNTARFVASQLAREGVELVRNIRDGNWLEQAGWQEGLTDCLGPTGCEIDYNDSELVEFQDRFLQIDSNGFYHYTLNEEDAKFKRKIIITPSGDEYLGIEVKIFWGNSSSTVEEKLYDWR